MKEQFSEAYVRAVAATSGYSVTRSVVDDDSVDVTFVGRNAEGAIRSPRLEAQLKCTSEIREDGPIPFRLNRKNYDDLRTTQVIVPRVLIVVFVPADPADWLRQGEEALLVHHCGYWMSLRDMPELPQGQQTTTVYLPRDHLFDVDHFSAIMARISNEALP